MRLAALILAAMPLSSAEARPHHPHRPPAQVCESGELRVSAPRDAWFDVYVDGRKRAESRVRDGQQRIQLAPGRHHVRVTGFMGRMWSEETVIVRCGDVLIGEVYERSGMQMRTRLREPTARPVSYRRGPARACSVGSLGVSGFDNTWFDLYVDGVKRVESRNFDSQQRVHGLQPGRHFVRVTSFMGEVWSEGYVDVHCGQDVVGEVLEDRGLRLF